MAQPLVDVDDGVTFGCSLLMAAQWVSLHPSFSSKEKAAFPGGKTAYLARSRMVQPRHVLRKEGKGRSVLALATLGP